MSGFDWLNIAGLQSDSDLPPPPVSFGVTPTSSTSSLNLKEELKIEPLNSKLVETSEDLQIPLSLRADQLTADEAKTYLRWYNDIVVRRGTNLIRLEDVFQFLRNFSISQQCKELLTRIFREVNSLNLGEFFAFLRIIAHTILGKTPMRRLIKEPAPIPKPRSILSAKRLKEEDEEEEVVSKDAKKNDSFDLDSFTTMLLTGQNPSDQKKKKKKTHSKRIKFSDQVSVEPTHLTKVEPVKIDLSLPMDQLLNKIPPKQVSANEEDEELKEMQDSFQHFRNIKNVDSALIHGTPSNIPSIFFDESSPNLQSPSPDPTIRPLAPNHTGPVLAMNQSLLSPNHTGQLQPFMNGYLQPSLTGSFRADSASPQFIHRDNTPPIPPTRRSRSASSPIPLENQHVSLEQLAMSVSKDRVVSDPPLQQPTLSELQAQRVSSPNAPVPPPPRRRGMSQPVPPPPPPPPSRFHPPLPPKIELDQSNGFQQNYQSSAADILGDLKALQNEVDRLQYYQT